MSLAGEGQCRVAGEARKAGEKSEDEFLRNTPWLPTRWPTMPPSDCTPVRPPSPRLHRLRLREPEPSVPMRRLIRSHSPSDRRLHTLNLKGNIMSSHLHLDLGHHQSQESDLPPVFGPGSLANRTDPRGCDAAGQDEAVPVGGRNPGGAGVERRTGGQTAEQSMTPGRKTGCCAWCVPQLRCGVEHGASQQGSHAAAWAWAASKAAGER